MITRKELIKKYIDFFIEKGHKAIPSAPLVPENDPTVLFTTAGMHPLVPYLLGEKHPLGKRIVDAQKCIRTPDIEDVGDNRHLTFFEMLGNWSLGDYFKSESIEWSFEFLTEKKWLGLDPKRIYVTVFMGDKNSPLDEESINSWKKQFKKAGINAKICDYNKKISKDTNLRIFPLPAKDNWWGPAGKTGPCGPCTEIFYDVSPNKGGLQGTFDEEINKFRIIEIWNNVFMEFNKNKEENFEKMKRQNVDTGMGVERTIAILNNKENVFETDSFEKIIKKVEKLSNKKYENYQKEMRIIADHIKASVFIIADGVTPSNTERGYVLRRLIRRAIIYGKRLDLQDFTVKIAKTVFEIYDDYEELEKNKEEIFKKIQDEEDKFNLTLEKGLKQFNKMTEFKKEFSTHQKLSQTASAGTFKSGLADNSKATTALHTAAHLLLSAIRMELKDDSIIQRGSNITPERLRLDFNFNRKLTEEEIQKIEDRVNAAIQKSCEVIREEMSPEEARKQGALGSFGHKYGSCVSVYTVSGFSKEICTGPHVKNTCELGKFKILKEESSSAGIRRIKAILK